MHTTSPTLFTEMPGARAEGLSTVAMCLAMAVTLILCNAVGQTMLAFSSRYDKIPVHTSRLTGQDWIDELLIGHDGRFYNELGLNKHVFRRLITVLERDAGLCATRHVSAEEQLAVFLHYARCGLSNRALQERFQRSADTITK
jgi:hypothetical protein